jgi:hypothetical protein
MVQADFVLGDFYTLLHLVNQLNQIKVKKITQRLL